MVTSSAACLRSAAGAGSGELSEHRSQNGRQRVVQVLRHHRDLSANSGQDFREHDAALSQDVSDLTDQRRSFADQSRSDSVQTLYVLLLDGLYGNECMRPANPTLSGSL